MKPGSEAQARLEALELKISHFLRGGVAVSGVFLAIGWIGLLLNPKPFSQFTNYSLVPLTVHLSNAVNDHDYAMLIAYFGLFVLISLPMLRVLMTCWLFLRGRDYILAAVAGFVLLALIASFSLGIEL